MFGLGGDGHIVDVVGIVVVEDEQVFVPAYRRNWDGAGLVAMELHAA